MNLPESLPLDERPRERLLCHGAGVLTDPELLALILRTGGPGCNAIELGRQLIRQFGHLRGLFAATASDLIGLRGVGQAKACQLLAVMELARRSIAEDLQRRPAMDQPLRVKEYCLAMLGHHKIEHCIALLLDTQLRLITCVEVARGTLAQASVYPREVVCAGLLHHAGALVLAHNHPSGLAQASAADQLLTRHLKQALALVDIRLIDHLIVAGGRVVSLAEEGQI